MSGPKTFFTVDVFVQKSTTGNQSEKWLGPLLTLSPLFIFVVGESAAVTSALGAACLDHSCESFSGR